MMWDKVCLLGGLITFGVLCSPAQSLSVRGGNLCPQAFIGKVEDIIEGQPPYTTLSKNEIIFKNIQTVRGKVSEKEKLSILKYGPLRLERGTNYLVTLRNKRICSIEKTKEVSQK